MMLVAHQGWDELLLAAAVALTVFGILRWSERRARERAEEAEEEEPKLPPTDG